MNLKKISIGVFILASGYLSGQDAGFNQKGIKANFTQKSIEAYQENSQNKLKDFYEFLSLYSHENNGELRKQIQSNILSMVSSETMEVMDFTTSSIKLIALTELLKKIENQNYTFEISKIESSENISLYEWENFYQLKITKGNHSEIRKVSQAIIFEPLEKRFGNKSKLVWELKLNEMLGN